MTRAEVKELLQSYQKMEREKKHLEEMIARKLSTLGGSSPQSDGLPRGNKTSDPTAERAIAVASLIEKYDKMIVNLTEKCNEIEELIDGLDPMERQLARLRYIDGMQWERVCVEMSYSWKQVHRIHAAILGKLATE